MKTVLALLVGSAAVQLLVTACGTSTSSASVTAPTAFTEICDKSYMRVGDATTKYWYAEHDFPGRSWQDLAANVTVAVPIPADRTGAPYSYDVGVIQVADGKAIVDCNETGQSKTVIFLAHN